MTLATTALALYLRTKIQFRYLTNPAPPSADHNHPPHPITVAFPLHPPEARPRTRRRRRPHRFLTNTLRRLLPTHPLPPPVPVPPTTPIPTRPTKSSSCRLCAAMRT